MQAFADVDPVTSVCSEQAARKPRAEAKAIRMIIAISHQILHIVPDSREHAQKLCAIYPAPTMPPELTPSHGESAKLAARKAIPALSGNRPASAPHPKTAASIILRGMHKAAVIEDRKPFIIRPHIMPPARFELRCLGASGSAPPSACFAGTAGSPGYLPIPTRPNRPALTISRYLNRNDMLQAHNGASTIETSALGSRDRSTTSARCSIGRLMKQPRIGESTVARPRQPGYLYQWCINITWLVWLCWTCVSIYRQSRNRPM